MKAVILAGGLGTRLRPYTKSLPKPMLPLGGKPILEYEIEWARKNGIKEIVLCVSYLRNKIQDYFGDGKKFGVKIEYAVSKKPLATAGQLKTAEKLIDDIRAEKNISNEKLDYMNEIDQYLKQMRQTYEKAL